MSAQQGVLKTTQHKNRISQSLKGHSVPIAVRNKIRDSLKGKYIGESHSCWKQRKLCLDCNKPISRNADRCLQCRGIFFSGDNGHRWNPFVKIQEKIRWSKKYCSWRISIFVRDNWTCQECGKNKCYVEAHHKKSFALIIKENNIETMAQALKCKELWNLFNGVTLCKECHDETKKENR